MSRLHLEYMLSLLQMMMDKHNPLWSLIYNCCHRVRTVLQKKKRCGTLQVKIYTCLSISTPCCPSGCYCSSHFLFICLSVFHSLLWRTWWGSLVSKRWLFCHGYIVTLKFKGPFMRYTSKANTQGAMPLTLFLQHL